MPKDLALQADHNFRTGRRLLVTRPLPLAPSLAGPFFINYREKVIIREQRNSPFRQGFSFLAFKTVASWPITAQDWYV